MMIRREDIQIRDPFILPVSEERKYYLYGTTDKNAWEGKATGFDVYVSNDLELWDGPFPAFRPGPDFWADRNFWAPEVHYYQGNYYMLASFKADDRCRGTQILFAGTPKGPFIPYSSGPVTPTNWECLDGTLYIDENNQPWLVFCHEWVQVHDGEMCAVKLTKDFNTTQGRIHMLFKASEAPWSTNIVTTGKPTNNVKDYITDGPFLYKPTDGQLLMLWSSASTKGYAIGIAKSLTDNILGPWRQEIEPLFSEDGGHGMLFKTFAGELMLTLHAPNKSPAERCMLIRVSEKNGQLHIE